MEPTIEKDEYGEVIRSGIYTYGETVHIFVERKNYEGVFLPGYEEWKSEYKPTPTGTNILTIWLVMLGGIKWING